MEKSNQQTFLKDQEMIFESNQEVEQEKSDKRIPEAKEIDIFFKVLDFFEKFPELFEDAVSNFVTTLKKQSLSVYSVCLSADGSMVASGSADNTVKVWNVKERKVEFTLEGHSEYVHSVNFSADGSMIASGSLDGTVKIWNVKEKSEEFTLEGHLDSVNSVCFIGDGSMIASGSSDETVKVWNVKERKEEISFEGHSSEVISVSARADGLMIASGSGDDTVKVWNLKDRKKEFTLKGHSGSVHSVCFIRDGSMIVSGSSDRTVKVWNVKERRLEFTLEGHSGGINSVCFIGDGSKIASGSKDKLLKVWNVKDRKEEYTLEGHSNRVLSVCFSTDGSMIVSGSADEAVKVWNIKERKEVVTLKGHSDGVKSVCFNSDGSLIASGSLDRKVKVWSVKDGKEEFTLEGHLSNVSSVCFSEDGSMIASGSFDRKFKVWNVKERKKLFTRKGHSSEILSICFSTDCLMIASGSRDKTVKIWNLKDKKAEFTFEGHSDRVNSVCFSTDGSMIASGSMDRTVKVWNVKERKEIFTLEGHSDGINSVCFSADGSMIASGSLDSTVKVWNVKERKEEFTLKGHSDYIHSVCFNADGSMIASGSTDETVKIWNVKERKEESSLEGHLNRVHSVCFSKDGSMIASGSEDETVKVWSVRERKNDFSLGGKLGGVIPACFNSGDLIIPSGPDLKAHKVFPIELKNDSTPPYSVLPSLKELTFPVDYAASYKFKVIAIRKFESIVVWSVSPPEKKFKITGYPRNLWKMGFSKEYLLICQNRFSNKLKIFDSFGKEVLINGLNSYEIPAETINLSVGSIFSAGLYNSLYHYSALHVFKQRKSYDLISQDAYNVTISNNKYSPLHLLSYLGETNLIKKVLGENSRMRVKADYFNRSPVFYSILGKHQAITDLLIDYISQAFTRGGRNELMSNFLAIEYDLPQIIENSSLSICALLDTSFSVRDEAPQFGTIIKTIRYSSLSNFSFTELADFTSKNITEPLNLKVSAFRLPEIIGSESSIHMLNCILKCKIKDIYKLPVIRQFLNERWNRIRPFIIFYTFLLWINLVCLIALVLRYDGNYISTASFAAINGLLTIWEMFKLKSNGLVYFTSYWNLVEVLRIVTSYLWLILLFYEIENEALEWITVVLNLVRGITGFRAFETTRYYIKLISDSLISIKSFLLVFIYTTLAFGLLKIVTSKTDSDLSSIWKDSFGMASGNSDMMDSDQLDLKYLTFVAAIFLNIILMLNMIISILGDSFDEFQLFATFYNGKEMAEVILEIETILAIFTKGNMLNHLHSCFNAYEVDEVGWKGKIIDMRVYIDSSTAKNKKDADEKFRSIQAILESNKKSLEDRITSLESKLDYLIASITK